MERGTLGALLQEDSFFQFRDEYDKIHRALKTSLQTERLLLQKVRARQHGVGGVRLTAMCSAAS